MRSRLNTFFSCVCSLVHRFIVFIDSFILPAFRALNVLVNDRTYNAWPRRVSKRLRLCRHKSLEPLPIDIFTIKSLTAKHSRAPMPDVRGEKAPDEYFSGKKSVLDLRSFRRELSRTSVDIHDYLKKTVLHTYRYNYKIDGKTVTKGGREVRRSNLSTSLLHFCFSFVFFQ